MVWDLGKAMRKKEEFESARLMDFEFRERALAARLLARSLELDEVTLVRQIAERDEAGILALASDLSGQDLAAIAVRYQQCKTEARKALIAQRGDPTPYRLG